MEFTGTESTFSGTEVVTSLGEESRDSGTFGV